MNRRNWEFRNYKAQDGKERRELYITGEISEYDWWGDETTPSNFESELYDKDGDVDIWINSPGGDVFAAAKIYNAITQYKGGKVTAYLYGFCASAATVVTMAASEVYMSPTALMLIHNPFTFVGGEQKDMEKAGEMLATVKETIINAYEKKTKLSRKEISDYMDIEKAFDATEAVKLGFADGMIESEQDKFSAVVSNNVINNTAMARFYNSVRDWKLAFQAQAELKPRKQEESTMVGVENKTAKTEAPQPATEEIKAPAKGEEIVNVVDMKDFEAVVNEFKNYKEQSKREIDELREYKARQEAEFKAKDLIGLPGITDERRIELARMADDTLFEELKNMANAMNELTKPVGVEIKEKDEENAIENKEEMELRKKIKEYATAHNVSEGEAYHAVVNGGK